MKIPDRGYASLRRFRQSHPDAEYFITCNLRLREFAMESALRDEVQAECLKLQVEGQWVVRTAVVMPDHIHLLVRLGNGVSVAECIRLLKGRLVPPLRANGLQWQTGFYEHEIRSSEDLLPVFLYIYLNPYRAGLLTAEQPWPGYYCASDDWVWFSKMTKGDLPQPEWLR